MNKIYIKFSEPTPNPSSYKWIVSEAFAGDDMYEFLPDDHNNSELSQALWTLNEYKIRITRIFFHDNIIVLNKANDIEWEDDFIREINSCIETHFTRSCELEHESNIITTDEEKMIFEVIKDYIQPAVSKHGGYIKFHSFQDGVVFLSMHGACDGCASASMTLHNGVESILKFYVPNVDRVELIQ